MKTATVKDVAQKAGVSTATVSRVLNGDRRVKPETAALVNRAIGDLGYRMNRVARSLKTARTQTVGVVAPEFGNEFFMGLVTGIEKVLKKAGYSVFLCSSREKPEEEKSQLRLLNEKGVDGMIVIPASSSGSHFKSLEPTPLVLVDRLTPDYPCDAVLADNFEGAREAVASVIAGGARRFAFLGGDRKLSTARERYEGFMRALEEGGLTPREEDILFGDYHSRSGYELMARLMEGDDPPRHIFISNYFMHLGAAQYLLEKEGIHGDLHLVSFDDMPLVAFFPYSSVIIAQPMVEMGEEAARLLLRRMGGDRHDFPRMERLPTRRRDI